MKFDFTGKVVVVTGQPAASANRLPMTSHPWGGINIDRDG